MSKEQVIEIERYCNEHGITRKHRIEELGLSITLYYYTRGLLTDAELCGGQFLPVISDSDLMPSARSRKKQHRELSEEDLKDVTGGVVRVAGEGAKLMFQCPDGRMVESFEQCQEVYTATPVGTLPID